MKEKIYLNKEHEKVALIDKALTDYMSKCEAELQQRKNNKRIFEIESQNRHLGQKVSEHERNIFNVFEKLIKMKKR